MGLLECEGLTRRFGERTAVDDVGFVIEPGESYGLLGPNGSGKTTTISMLVGVMAPTTGSVRIGGHDIASDGAAARALVGLVPQEIALYEDLSAKENLQFFGRLQGMTRRRLKSRIDEVLEVVGLIDRAEDRVAEFSGGMKRRINIAVGLLHEPSLLVLDEPTVGVDPQSRNQILEAVEQLGGDGMSVLYTTHYMEEAERLCDRIGILDEGRMIAEGSKAELVSDLGTHEVVAVAGAFDEEDSSDLLAVVRSLPEVLGAQLTSRGLEVITESGGGLVAPLVGCLGAHDVAITGVEVQSPNLEAVFLGLTGRALRD